MEVEKRLKGCSTRPAAGDEFGLQLPFSRVKSGHPQSTDRGRKQTLLICIPLLSGDANNSGWPVDIGQEPVEFHARRDPSEKIICFYSGKARAISRERGKSYQSKHEEANHDDGTGSEAQ
jgi:hypothetical protein